MDYQDINPVFIFSKTKQFFSQTFMKKRSVLYTETTLCKTTVENVGTCFDETLRSNSV